MKSLPLILLFGSAGFWFGGDARAEEPLAIGGFGTASYSGDFDRRSPEFRLDQVELDATRTVGPEGSLRADLEWTPNGNEWIAAVEQAWFAYAPSRVDWLTVTGGRFNAPIGYESLDAPDMQQISHALVFNFCTPSNLTGVMGRGDLGRGADLKIYAANDWETNSENNAVPTFGGRLGGSRGALSGGLSAISGKRDAAQKTRTTVLDVDLSFAAAPRLSFGGEFNYGQVSSDGSKSWTGMLALAHWQWREAVGFTGRFDWLDDPDDLLVVTGRVAQRSAVTATTIVTLGPGVRAMAELRRDQAVSDVYLDHDGKPKRSNLSGAINLTFGL